MSSIPNTEAPILRFAPDLPMQDTDLRLRELNHRCSNDLQMVSGLLALLERRAQSMETKDTLRDARNSVAILARSRAMLQRDELPTLETALRQVCEALQCHAEPRSIQIVLTAENLTHELSPRRITTVALAVNELITNALKHAFSDDGGGTVRVQLHDHDEAAVCVTVDDDGEAFAKISSSKHGLGLDLVTRLVESLGGIIIARANGSKTFEIRVPYE